MRQIDTACDLRTAGTTRAARKAGLITGLVSIFACALVMSGCSVGPVRRVSEPTASIQQLSVGSDGTWSVDLRLQNYSSVPMQFEQVSLNLQTDGQEAGELRTSADLSVGPESADFATIKIKPSSQARIALTAALADGRSVNYSLQGNVTARPKDGNSRKYKIKRNSALSPVPGLPGVLR